MSLGGAGRGLLCAPICKLAGRHQRMLLIVLVAMALAVCFVFSSLVNSKDQVRSFVNPAFTTSGRSVTQRDFLSSHGPNTASQTEKQFNNIPEKVEDLLPNFPPAVVLDHHPCENFSFSLPPMDRKRTGPRRPGIEAS